MTVTPDQLRAARTLLRLEQDELARQAGVSVATIRRLEAAGEGARVTPATLLGVQRALEQAGAEFIAYGVRRRQAAADLYRDLQVISRESAALLGGQAPLSEADLYGEDGLPA